MTINWQKASLFAVGLAFGVGAGVFGVSSLRDDGGPPTRSMGAAPSGATAAAAPPALAAAAGQCQSAPLLKAGDGDGRRALQASPAGGTKDEVAGLILRGKEAAAAGHQRDAEVSFLDACRMAAQIQGGDGVPLADAMYQLARHYTNAAAFGAPRSKDLYERAEKLYSASVAAYQGRYGDSHEKTRFAQEGLITVRQVTGSSSTTVASAAPAPVAAAAPAAPATPTAPAVVADPPMTPGPATPPVAAVKPPARPEPVRTEPRPVQAPPQASTTPSKMETPPVQARRTAPSFDCAKARSTTERLICQDEDLARQDRELGRLHARAKQAAADPRAFQRDSDAQWQRREANCTDRECLQRWYAQRRAELSAAAATASASDAPAPRPRARPAPTPAPVEVRPPVASGEAEVSPPIVLSPVVPRLVPRELVEPSWSPPAPPVGTMGGAPTAGGDPGGL